MSCGEPSKHLELFEEEISKNEMLKIFLKAVDITPTNMIMQNGVISKTDKNWYGNKVRHNFIILKEIWETLEDETL
tara:strand:- start:601 stop:828 length:228 start_codon:yes stop_codon:yes gene_type:complete